LSTEQQAALGDGHVDLPTVLPREMAESPAVTAWQAAREEVRRWRQRTDAAAADHHRLHLAASRLTAHHQGSLSVPVPDRPQEYAQPEWRSEAPEPYTITDGPDGTDSAPRTLTSPDGATVREVHDMPHDGASFFHALIAVAEARGRLSHLLGTDLAERFTRAPGDPAVTADAIDAARARLASALGEDGNEDLLDALALDVADTFTQTELDAAEVTFTPAQQAEFDAFGRLPLTFWPTPAQRIALATTALSRPFTAEPRQDGTQELPDGEPAPPARRAGDHGGADLLPALAARVLGTPLTVVTGEGREQVFLPHGTDPAAVDPVGDPVLFAADGFFHAALPPGTPAPVATALPTPATEADPGTGTSTAPATDGTPATRQPPAHRSHTTPPWTPPADSDGPRYRLARDGVLTAPDGATYTQDTPTGRGNGFFGALSGALSHAADQPGLYGPEVVRLRRLALATPAQLMRLHGLPGDPAQRDSLFSPPPLVPLRSGATPSPEALEAHMRRHLTRAPWGPDADRAVARWAAATTGTTVTLIEENGTAHTYPGPAGGDGPHIRLRRRGGDIVPLTLRTPAPEPARAETRTTPDARETPSADTPVVDVPIVDTTPTAATSVVSEPVVSSSVNSSSVNSDSVDSSSVVPEPVDATAVDEAAAVDLPPVDTVAVGTDTVAVDTEPVVPPVVQPSAPPSVPPRLPLPSHEDAAAVPLPPSPVSQTVDASPELSDGEEEARELSTLSGAGEGSDVPTNLDAVPTASEPALRSFKLGNFEFTNLNQTDRYVEKAVRIVELLDEHAAIKNYVGGRPVRVTLRLRVTEAPADVIDRGVDGVDINLASYYFEKYDTGYVMGMLAHEIGLHPLASRNGRIAEEEDLFAGMPLAVPGLESLSEPRFMNTIGSGQADHVMAAFPQSIRHGMYRDVIVEMARVLERRARVGVQGAKAKDVTDLFDTYLMDLASIAVTNDHRARAVTDPGYTARSYNAYKAQLDAHLPQDSRLRALLPADKGRWGVLGDFAQLAASVGTNNRGDSIQRPAPTGEARPRLPQGSTGDQRAEGQALPQGARDSRPRFVVRSGFDARRFMHAGDPVTDLTVRVAFRGTGDQGARTFGRLAAGVEEFLNDPAYRLPNGDRLHVTVEHVGVSDSPHLTVDLVGREQGMDQVSWWADAAPVQLVHELTHQLGLRDEYRDADSPHRPHVLGSLLGDLDADPEDSSLVASGLRDRHLALLGALIGDVDPAPEEAGRSFEEARSAAVPDTREAVWVDPVSLPRTADDTDGTAVTEVPARMVRGEGLLPFGSGNFTFTNLNYGNDAYRGKAIRVLEALRSHAVIGEYVGGRPVWITLHVRTTETPADVIDLDVARQAAAMRALEAAADSGDDEAADAARAELEDALADRPAAQMRGVEINLASYYFEKYDVGYVMGMLAHEIGLHPLASARDELAGDEKNNREVAQPVPGLPGRVMKASEAGQEDHVMAASPERKRHEIYRDVVVEMARVLAQQVANRDEGAVAKDVTDLFDTYLMDVATIAVTNDHRGRAVLEPVNTARVYNAYKQLLREQLADTPALQALLPPDKGWRGVAGNFTRLAASIATRNVGDSIQRPAPAYEARPRLPQSTAQQSEDVQNEVSFPARLLPQGARDGRPRFVVRSGFDARRFTHAGDPVTDLTVRVALRGTEEQKARVREQLGLGIQEFLNERGYRLPNGDRLHVTVEPVDVGDSPHLTVDLVGRDRAMDQSTWWVDAAPVQLVHELTHQLGLRDEYRDADAPHRPHVLGSLLGDLNADPEETSLAPAGLRDRHLALLGALIGDVAPAPEEAGRSWEEARSAAVPDTREAVWVDPVSLPSPSGGSTATEVPAHMPQDTDAASTEPVLRSFRMGNYEFTNLNQTDRYVEKAMRIVELLDEHATIKNYVGGRPVRITLHVRTTEAPADVIDRGDDGVDINLASYYFEKYDTGYVMGMLAHEIALHPLASRNVRIAEEEDLYAGMPLTVPGLESLNEPRFMNTVGSGQADHVMAAFPHTIRHGVYRDAVVEMARVLEQRARVGVTGAKSADVTDLFDTYLMDLASIAVTNDHRARAVTDPGYTARSYNAYKAQLDAHLPADSRLRALLPADKGRWGVLRDFAQLATSVGTNNRGDSIQRPAPAGEARPRLPQGTDNGHRTEEEPDRQALPGVPLPQGARDTRPRFVVRSGFDVRRFTHDGDPVTDLTVRVALRGAGEQGVRVRERLDAGVVQFLNDPGHRLPNGDRLHVTVEYVDPADSPHLTVDLVGRDRAMDQTTWWTDAAPVELVHELTHQLGLRDEYRDADAPHRSHVPGSLLGDLEVAPEDLSLAAAGLRGRHLALLGALIGDVTPAPEEVGRSFAEARGAAVADAREAVWVDPVSLPQPSADDDATGVGVPARMRQGEDLLPFGSGNFVFTNLNYERDAYRNKAVRVIQALRGHGIIGEYVGGRPVRITLHVRTTETPADVIDLDVARQDAAMRALEAAADSGDAEAAEVARAELAEALVVRPAAEMRGVEINLASYYFEKYDIGYLMGMLAHEIGLHPLASAQDGLGRDEADNAGKPQRVPGLPENRVMNTVGAGQADHIMAASPERVRHRIYRDVVVEMARVLAQQAANGDEGAGTKDVTDLFDTYLMDVATIAVTNDHRARAVTDPGYTARSYNAYKAQLDEHLPQDSPLRALLPADKSRWGVLGDFAQLAASVGTNNRGDSIQRPAPTGEARPRLPQGQRTGEVAESDGQVPPPAPLSQGARD
ncbi:hypothetical protein ACFT0E_16620, partial [Streptomyces sp. NPDC057052]